MREEALESSEILTSIIYVLIYIKYFFNDIYRFMAGKISELSVASSLNSGDELEVLQSGSNKRMVASLINSIISIAVSALNNLGTGVSTLLTTAANGTSASGIGYQGVPQNSKSADYTIAASDNGKHIYHPGADTTARTWTIDSNANLALPIGFIVTFVNDTSAGVITIAITTDTLVFAADGSTGSRTLAESSMATALKVTSTRWMISGTNGLT